MTPREQLIGLVERLDETEVAEVLKLLATRYGESTRGERRLPAFVGMGHSGRGDLGRRSKEILREELGGRVR